MKGFSMKYKPVTNLAKELLNLVSYCLFEMPVEKKQYQLFFDLKIEEKSLQSWQIGRTLELSSFHFSDECSRNWSYQYCQADSLEKSMDIGRLLLTNRREIYFK